MSKWIYLILFIVAFNTVEHFCHKKTDGFSLGRIQFQDTSPIGQVENIPDALNQSFHYLDCGNQCFAFISEDGTCVLKFFKYARSPIPAWMTKIPLLNRFKPLRIKRFQKVIWKRERDFQGYELAFKHFREETGLLALHLTPSQNLPTIHLYDKLRIRHSLDLNKVPFILQKKATPIYTQFSTWLQNGELDKAKEGIKKLIDLCALRLSKEIYDDDVHFYSNFGFVDETPIQVDPGHFVINHKKQKLDTLTVELKEWFAKNYPPLVSYVEDCTFSH